MTTPQRLVLSLASIAWIALFLGEARAFTCVSNGDCPRWKLALLTAPFADETWPDSLNLGTTTNNVYIADENYFLIVGELQ
jgi:hypothetical protein